MYTDCGKHSRCIRIGRGEKEADGGRRGKLFGSMPGFRLPALSPGQRHMVGAAFFFSLMSLMVKMAGRHLPTWEMVFFRSLVMLIICTVLIRRQGIPTWGNHRGLLIARGVFGFVALNFFYYSIVHLPLSDATTIMFTNAVFTALLAVIFLAEHFSVRQGVLIGISLAGVMLVAQPTALFGGLGSGLDQVAVTIGLGGALMSAAAWVTIRRLGHTEESLVIIFYFSLVSTLGALPLLAIEFVMPTPMEWLMLIGLGVFTHFGQIYLTRALKLERAGRAAPVGYVQIVFAALWGVFFFAEIPNLLSIAGAVVIVLSTIMMGRRPAQPTL